MMGDLRVCVAGAGAVGGLIAAKLAQAGHAVNVLARGEHLRAVEAQGLTLLEGDTRATVRVAASSAPDGFGPQDVVFIAFKAPSLIEAASALEPLLKLSVKLIQATLRDRPKDLTVCTHICRGNFRSAWRAQGGYSRIAEVIFNQMPYDGFFLEFDDARSGEFSPLRHVPENVRVVLGLVTTKVGTLEKKDDLKRRLDEASKYIPLDRLCVSPQCGFSSTVEGNEVAVEEQKAKLSLCVELAREVWGSL